MLRFVPQADVAPPERSAVVEPFQAAIRSNGLLRSRLALSPESRDSSCAVGVNSMKPRTCEWEKNWWLSELGEDWATRRKGKESFAQSEDAQAWRNISSC